MLADRRYASAIVTLLWVAMGLFVFTVVVGILNGTDAVDFEQKVLLTHVHAGTLGWITLSVFASALWLFGGDTTTGARSDMPATLAYLAAASVVAYVVAFLTSTGWARPIIGGVVSLVIAAFFVWTLTRRRVSEMSVPQLGFVVALFTSVVGGVLGVLWGVVIASRYDVKALPDGGEGAHPAMMVIGFLVPVAAAMAEWWLMPDRAEGGPSPKPRAGMWQMGLLFVGSVFIMSGILVDVEALIIGAQPFLIAALVIIVVRLAPVAMQASERSVQWWHGLLGLGWMIFSVGYTIVLVNIYEGDLDPDNMPARLLLALDHALFIGAMTNAVFALLIAVTAARATVVDKLVLWGINLGIAGFWLGLVIDVAEVKRIATPVMGTAILVGLGVAASRLVGVATSPGRVDRST